MAVVLVRAFRSRPGKEAQLASTMADARSHLTRLGVAAISIEPIAGTEPGVVGIITNHADYRDFTTAYQKVSADKKWQKFSAEIAADAPAEMVESSVFTDIDPAFAPAADRPLGVIQTTQWRPRPGRAGDLMQNIGDARPHIERIGGSFRALQCVIGAHPLTLAVSVTFEDLDHFGDFSDKVAVDEGFQTYWVGVMADPSAELVRSGIYLATAT